jgi:hypothetical protein
VTVAGQWYASAAFADTVALIAIALVAMLVGARVAVSTGFPRRRLYWSMPVIAPLLSAPEGMRDDLELRRNGIPLRDPHLLEVHLASRSRRDISSDDFDSHEPLRLDVGANIVEILRTSSTPATPPAPDITHDTTALKIGPSLIGKRQRITITVVADGADPHLTIEARLINVDVREQKPEDASAPALNNELGRQQLAAVVGIVVGLAAYEMATLERAPLSTATAWIGTVLLLTGAMAQIWMIVTLERWARNRRRRKRGL